MTGVGAMASRVEMPVPPKGRGNPDAERHGGTSSDFADLLGKGAEGAEAPKSADTVVLAKTELRETAGHVPPAAEKGEQATFVPKSTGVEKQLSDGTSSSDAVNPAPDLDASSPDVKHQESAQNVKKTIKNADQLESTFVIEPDARLSDPKAVVDPTGNDPVPVDADVADAADAQAPILIATPAAGGAPVAQVEAAPLKSLPLWSLRGGRDGDAGVAEHRPMPTDMAMIRPSSARADAPVAMTSDVRAAVKAFEGMAMPAAANGVASGEKPINHEARSGAIGRDIQPMSATERSAVSQNVGSLNPGATQTPSVQTPTFTLQPAGKTDGQTPTVALATVDAGRWLDEGMPPKALRETVASHVTRASLMPASGQSAPVLKLQLQPAHLGQVTVTIRAIGDVVTVQLAPQSEAAAQMLVSDRDAMATVLRSLGGSFASAQVEIAGDFGGRLDGESGQWRSAPGGGRDDTSAQRGGSAGAGPAEDAVNRPPDQASDQAQVAGGRIII